MDARLRRALRSTSVAMSAFADSATDYERLLDTIVHSVTAVVPDACVISLHSDDNQTITNVAMYDADPAVMAVYAPVMNKARPLQASPIASTALQAGTVLMPALDLASLAAGLPPDAAGILTKIGVRGMVVAPLRARGELLGLMTVLRYRAELPPLDETDQELVEHIAHVAAMALANAKLTRVASVESAERRHAEERLAMSEAMRLLEAQAAETAKFVDAILENIPDMVFVKDAADLRFVRFNKAGEELLGFARADLIGKNDYDFFPASEAEFFIQKDRETLAQKQLVDIPEEPIKTKSGDRWLHTKKVPILDEQGEPRFLLGISHDITQRKAAVASLEQARDRAEAMNRELESFSYSVAHDLRAPLRAIDGFSQALLDDYGKHLDEVGLRHLERIRAAAQRMAMLIDDLLRLSRVTRAEQRREPVNLSALARISIAVLERAEPERKVDISIEDDLEIVGDPKLLAIVFDNLFGNAWKFTSNTERARIELGTRSEHGERVFFVRDNGAGFDAAYRGKLFGVFQRLHPQHEYPGTGIGLATVKRIIERHGGRVWAEGAVGRGATFYFTLESS